VGRFAQDHARWSQEADEQGIAALPFFSEQTNLGFSAKSFHPTYYASRDLARFGLFYQTTVAAMQSAGIVTFGELLLHTPRQAGFLSRKKVEWFQQRIRAFLLGHSVQLDTSSPERFVRSMLGTNTDASFRNEVVVLRLLGHTLEEIGHQCRKSREWIRQCFAANLAVALHGFQAARNILTDALNSIGGCGTLESVRLKLMETFGWNGQECTGSFVYALLHDFFKDDFVQIGGPLYATADFPCMTCEKFDAMVVRVMENYYGAWSQDAIHSFAMRELPKSGECSRCLERTAAPPVEWILHKLKRKSPLWIRLREPYVRRLKDRQQKAAPERRA
jgi:hypothetical protein